MMSKGVVREQTNDKYCQGLKPGPYHSKREYFRNDEGLIYRRRPENKHQLIIPSALVADVIREKHDPDSVAHPGVKCTCQQRKNREIQTGECVYLYNPARRPGVSRKFAKSWSGPLHITTKMSDLNYEILVKNDGKIIVHINP